VHLQKQASRTTALISAIIASLVGGSITEGFTPARYCPLYHVAFFSDQAMLPGLHVALLSLLEAYESDRTLEINVFLDGVTAADKSLLSETVESVRSSVSLNLRDVTVPDVPGANSLHGNRTAYGRIFLAELLPKCDCVLYLDCDVVAVKSIAEWFALRSSGATIYADGNHSRGSSLDKLLFQDAGLDMSRSCFNSGAMLIDLSLWRKRDRTPECLRTAQRFPGRFRSADQALLNVVFHDDFVEVGSTFNHHLYPTTPPTSLLRNGARVLHFVGSPKPWDPTGAFVHHNYWLWRYFYERTALGGRSPLRYASVRRAFRTLPSVYRAWRQSKACARVASASIR
jgi:lipopolysaccharide biosynthesis glycosyltransferase